LIVVLQSNMYRAMPGRHTDAPSRCFRSFALLLLLVQHLRCVSAWGPDGHARIARIAMGALQDKPLRQIRKLMRGDLIDFVVWEKNLTATYPETARLSWHRQQPAFMCDGTFDLKGCDGGPGGAEADSLFCAALYFFDHFSHDALLSEFPTHPKPIPPPKELKPLANIPVSDLTINYLLQGLVSLIGDLHQPLHWLVKNDYGAEVKIKFRGRDLTLLTLWEEYIPRHLAFPPRVSELQKAYEQQTQLWSLKHPAELFRYWSTETASNVCRHILEPLGTNTTVELTEDTYKKWVEYAEDVMMLGGLRIAFVINDILEHRRHKIAHQDGRGHHSRSHRKNAPTKNGLLTNVAIAFIVVPAVLMGLKWHEGAGRSLSFGHLKP